jgi:glycosyltransferase involved in cell wall biosynthesis
MLQAILDGGHEVHYLRLEDAGRKLEGRSLPEGTQVVEWKGGKGKFRWRDSFSLALDLKRILVYVEPDIIHAGPIQTVGFIAALTGFHPLVSMSWGFDLMTHADKNFAYRWLTRNVLAKSDWLFGDCKAVLNRAAEFGYDISRSTYFPWGVDLTHFTPGENTRLAESLGWKDAFILFCNRSWEPPYGVEDVARAFVKAVETNPNLRLLLPGSGSLGPEIRGILQEGGVLDKVHMPGQVSFNDLPEYYRAADLYVSASHTDGSSVSLMEALACGLPALVSDIPGNREWVTPGDQGWIFPDRDSDRLAELMVKASQARVDLAVMSLKARHKAELNADWKINQQRLLDGYRAVLAK